MPPAAATVAGRRPARAAYAPPAPRRVSGPSSRTETRPPARPAVRPSARATAAAAALEGVLAPAPVRTRREAPARVRTPRAAPARHRERERVRELPRIDRIVRGRAWIPLLGVLLVAIVGLRVEVLKLGSSVGRELQQATTLESSNAILRSQVSALSDNQRIEQLAENMGMLMPGPTEVHFVKASAAGDVGATIKGIHEPETSDFLNGVADERQADAANSAAAAQQSAVGVLATGVSDDSDATSADTAANTTDASTTDDPTTDASTTADSTTDASTTDASTTDASTTDDSTDSTDSPPASSTTSDPASTGEAPADSTSPSGDTASTGPTTGGAALAG
jgi:hypothetical protein